TNFRAWLLIAHVLRTSCLNATNFVCIVFLYKKEFDILLEKLIILDKTILFSSVTLIASFYIIKNLFIKKIIKS
uniref:hypothetical protein n=1 Tax=Proteus mirabilis TaxID=584 RepID=UPI00313B289F